MDTVDYVKPADVAIAMAETGRRKLAQLLAAAGVSDGRP